MLKGRKCQQELCHGGRYNSLISRFKGADYKGSGIA